MSNSLNLYERLKLINSTNPYFSKDLKKAFQANKFIGRGSLLSSTNKYMLAAGELANTGNYNADDVVFISAEGARNNRLSIDKVEIKKAIDSSCDIITDSEYDRNRPYNLGEREVAKFLISHNYYEFKPGYWKKGG